MKTKSWLENKLYISTAQKIKHSYKDFFSVCEEIRKNLYPQEKQNNVLYLGVMTSVTLTPNWCGLGNVVMYLSEFGSKTLTSKNGVWDNNLHVF